MPHIWESFGKESDPIIALVALSDAFTEKKMVEWRIKSLVSKGFCVKIPRFGKGEGLYDNLLIEPDLARSGGRIPDAVSPAVSPEVGKQLVVDCINSGWNIAAFMGGESCKNKIILLVIEHFKSHPRDESTPKITIFGSSDTTYAAILAQHGICNFVSTPFTGIFHKSKTDPDLQESATRLERVLKGEEVADFPRSVIYDPANKLLNLEPMFYYPLNVGVLYSEIDGPQLLEIPAGRRWSVSIEGFIEEPGSKEPMNYTKLLRNFLDLHADNPPVFVEVGNIATRWDGNGGYSALRHGDDGKILISENNVNKVYAAYQNAGIKIDKEEIKKLLEIENEKIDGILRGFVEVVDSLPQDRKVALTQNTRNGHCANMDIVACGLIKVEVKGKDVVFSKAREEKSYLQAQGAKRVAAEAAHQEAARHND